MRITDIVYIALFAAIIAVLGLAPMVVLPVVPVPVTAQTLGVMLAGSILGARRGALAVVLFLVLVAAGLPLLAGGRGGLSVFAGPGAGFLLGWPLGALVIGWLVERFWSRLGFLRLLAIHLLGGILAIYAIGIPVLAWISGISIWQAALGALTFVPGDVLKAVFATSAALFVKRGYPLISPRPAGREGG
jgi:biotin transport system substrate-specific component